MLFVRVALIAGTTLIAGATLAACTAQAQLAIPDPVAPPAAARTGELLVYSATYASTIEQSEYPVHTNYTIGMPDDKVIRRVTNLSGPFYAYPAKITLPVGEYHVRAQFDRGDFVIVPVRIAPGQTTIVDLSHEPLPTETAPTRRPVRLPDGSVVGWLATSADPMR